MTLSSLFQNIPSDLIASLQPLEDLLLKLAQAAPTGVLYIPQPDPIGSGGNGFLGGGIGSMGTLNAPGLGALSVGGAGSARLNVAVDLSLNSGGLDWLDRLIDARVEAKTTGSAGGADVRRRTR
jgi:hypothetical protein